MSAGRSASVTVEWALWGRQTQGVRHLVLACSAGAVSQASFGEIVTRYLPGTLEDLPQVTIGWLRGRQRNGDHVALAVHERRPLPDSGGDHLLLARLFCVPFNQLANGTVRYLPLFERLSELGPPASDRHPIRVDLAVEASAEPTERADPLARRAAALLLTGKPVCLIGADHIDLAGRLGFIDTVASLLPYGLRSRLSAATSVSSTFDRHRFRLFFADAERNAGTQDHVLIWGNPDDQPVGHMAADRYLSLLTDGTLRTDRLAAHTEQADFSPADIDRLIDRLTTRDGAARPSSAGLADDPTIEMLLRSCASALSRNAGALPSDLNQLRRHLSAKATAAQRDARADLIENLELLSADPPIDEPQLGQFYDVMLRLAFETPLSYEAYCRAEKCCGKSPGQAMNAGLLRSLRQVGLCPAAELLVLDALGRDGLSTAFRQGELSPATIVSIAADPLLLPQHVKIVCEIIAGPVSDLLSQADRRLLKTELHQVGYLAPRLRDQFPGDPRTQLDLLSGLLRSAHGRRISRADIRPLLSGAHGTPTTALFVAILRVTAPRDVPFAAGQFSAALVAVSNLGEDVSQETEDLLARHCG